MLSSTSDDPIQMSECVLDTYTQTSHIHVQMYYFCEGMCSSIKNKLEYHHYVVILNAFFFQLSPLYNQMSHSIGGTIHLLSSHVFHSFFCMVM